MRHARAQLARKEWESLAAGQLEFIARLEYCRKLAIEEGREWEIPLIDQSIESAHDFYDEVINRFAPEIHLN
ncbi:MAG TPA: hypothetical protein VMR52_10775 [Dehalococcoidia bacterium]|nr:hypothetical protein [Dehalococcoidia bacterium]